MVNLIDLLRSATSGATQHATTFATQLRVALRRPYLH